MDRPPARRAYPQLPLAGRVYHRYDDPAPSTPWLKEAIQKYQTTKATPEFTIQGIMNDESSDYYAENGSETVTCVGCVLTGDLNLINLDSNGEIVDDSIAFNVKDIV